MNTENSSSTLQDANWSIHHRNVRLSDIIPSDQVSWLAILADGYINSSGCMFQVRSFDELESLQSERNLPLLDEIRARGILTEGERKLPKRLTNFLVEFSRGHIRVRRSGGGSIEMMSAQDFIDFVSDEMNDDEFEASTSNGAWYLRMRNDDALIFVAAPHSIAEQIISSFPSCVRAVSQEFIFVS